MGFAQKATGFHRTGLGTNDKPHRASQLLCPGIDLKGVAFAAQTITNKKIPETVSFAHFYYIFFRTNVHGTRESMERFTPFRSFHIAGCGLEEITRNLPERPPAMGKIAKSVIAIPCIRNCSSTDGGLVRCVRDVFVATAAQWPVSSWFSSSGQTAR